MARRGAPEDRPDPVPVRPRRRPNDDAGLAPLHPRPAADGRGDSDDHQRGRAARVRRRDGRAGVEHGRARPTGRPLRAQLRRRTSRDGERVRTPGPAAVWNGRGWFRTSRDGERVRTPGPAAVWNGRGWFRTSGLCERLRTDAYEAFWRHFWASAD